MPMTYTLTKNDEGERNITVFQEGGEPLVAHSSHPNFDSIVQKVLAEDESALDLFDITLAAGTKLTPLTERVSAVNGHLLFDGEEMHGSLVDMILRLFEEGDEQNWKPLAAFLENLASNPNEHSRNELYNFISKNGFTITTDGMIVGYKGLEKRSTALDGHMYQSVHSGTAITDGVVYKNSKIPQSVGSVVEMPRSEVRWEPGDACSVGLHVGNFSMAAGYGSKKFEVHVNPRDVVSVPTYGNKMRVCRYKVVTNCTEEITQPVVPAANERDEKGKAKGEVKVGDHFAQRDIRRRGTIFRVDKIEGDTAEGTSLPKGVTRKVKVERLFTRKYKPLTKREAKEILGGAQQ